MAQVLVRAYKEADEARVIELWMFGGLVKPWHDPKQDIERKLKVQRDLFLVAELEGSIVGVVMAGYEGHRGWVSSLAVDIGQRRRGIGTALMRDVERRLRALGCPKVKLQVRLDNSAVQAFYAAIGFGVDETVIMGKTLEDGAKPPQ